VSFLRAAVDKVQLALMVEEQPATIAEPAGDIPELRELRYRCVSNE
jgi:hypothetical protein